MIFSIDEGIFNLFPSLKIGVLVGEIDNTKYGEDRLEEALDDVKVHFSFERPQDHPNIKVWREAFKKLGVPTSKYQSSIESLLKRALKGRTFSKDQSSCGPLQRNITDDVSSPLAAMPSTPLKEIFPSVLLREMRPSSPWIWGNRRLLKKVK